MAVSRCSQQSRHAQIRRLECAARTASGSALSPPERDHRPGVAAPGSRSPNPPAAAGDTRAGCPRGARASGRRQDVRDWLIEPSRRKHAALFRPAGLKGPLLGSPLASARSEHTRRARPPERGGSRSIFQLMPGSPPPGRSSASSSLGETTRPPRVQGSARPAALDRRPGDRRSTL